MTLSQFQFGDRLNSIVIVVTCILLVIIGGGGIAWNVVNLSLIYVFINTPTWVYIYGIVVDSLFVIVAVIGLLSVILRGYVLFKARYLITMFFVAGLFVVFLLELIQVALNLYAAAVTIYDNSGTSANNAFRYTQIAIVIVVIIVSLCLCCSFIACGINQLEYIKARVFEVQYMADHPEYREDSFDPLTGLPPFVMPDKESTELL